MAKTQNSKIDCEHCASRHKGIFCELETLALQNLSDQKNIHRLKKGQILFDQGTVPDGIFCINQGILKLSKIGGDGKESIVRLVGSGDVLGHRSLFSEEPAGATATVIEDTTYCFIEKKLIMNLVHDKPQLALGLIKKLSQEMGAAEARSASLAQKSVRERIAEHLVLLAETFGKVEGHHHKLEIKLTREEFASLAGTTSETVIRVMSDFKEQGLLTQEGKTLFIENLPEMTRIAGLTPRAPKEL